MIKHILCLDGTPLSINPRPAGMLNLSPVLVAPPDYWYPCTYCKAWIGPGEKYIAPGGERSHLECFRKFAPEALVITTLWAN